MKKLSSGFTLEELVKRRADDIEQHKAAKKEKETMSAIKRQSHKKQQFGSLERQFGREIVAADKSSTDKREGFTRRNTAAAKDPLERQACILCVLQYLNKTFGKNYCFPSQAKIQDLLKRWYGLEISNRTLNRDLNSMEQRGHITRKRRLSWKKFSSTCYTIQKLGYVWWKALQKAFGLFKTSRLPNLADNNVILRIKGAYKDESKASNLTNKHERTPNGETLEGAT